MKQSVPKRRHTKFRRRRITQKKAYNIYFFVKFVRPLRKQNDLELLGKISQKMYFRGKGMQNVLGILGCLKSVRHVYMLQMFRSLF
jgi:hypothetical protein